MKRIATHSRMATVLGTCLLVAGSVLMLGTQVGSWNIRFLHLDKNRFSKQKKPVLAAPEAHSLKEVPFELCFKLHFGRNDEEKWEGEMKRRNSIRKIETKIEMYINQKFKQSYSWWVKTKIEMLIESSFF